MRSGGSVARHARTASTKSSSESLASTTSEPGRPAATSAAANRYELSIQSALLWRLQLLGVDVGARWQSVAEGWAPLATAGSYAFNDACAMMAFVSAGRDDLARAVLEAQDRA